MSGARVIEPRPVKWEVVSDPDYHNRVYVEEVEQRDGSILYAVRDAGCSVLGRTSGWLWMEPQPSSRDAAFLAEYRFATMGDALTALAVVTAHA